LQQYYVYTPYFTNNTTLYIFFFRPSYFGGPLQQTLLHPYLGQAWYWHDMRKQIQMKHICKYVWINFKIKSRIILWMYFGPYIHNANVRAYMNVNVVKLNNASLLPFSALQIPPIWEEVKVRLWEILLPSFPLPS
jgi:hypothetical protein